MNAYKFRSLSTALIFAALGAPAIGEQSAAQRFVDSTQAAASGQVVRVQRHNPADPSSAALMLVDSIAILPTDLHPVARTRSAPQRPAPDRAFEVHIQFADGQRQIRVVGADHGYSVGDWVSPTATLAMRSAR